MSLREIREHCNRAIYLTSTATGELYLWNPLNVGATVTVGAHWQLNCCGDRKVAGGGTMNACSLQLKCCLYEQLFFSQYVMDLTQTACVCALLLRIRKVQCKKWHWVHPIVGKRLLKGQFYKLYEDLRNCWGKFFNYFRMSIESFDKLLVLVGPRITHENTEIRLSVPPQGRLEVTLRLRKYLFLHVPLFHSVLCQIYIK
jgi:hypothetical protein